MKDQLEQLEGLFKALADATRLRILRLLMAGDVCVCDIHDALRIPQAKASRHRVSRRGIQFRRKICFSEERGSKL